MTDVVRGPRLLAAVAAVAFLAACGNLVDPDLPANAEQYTPPPVYARWWSMTQSCSGLSGDLSAVTWFMVPGVSTVLLNGKTVEGYWSLAGNRIVIAGAGRLAGGIVRHEMLHALMKAAGHPRAKFLGECGGVVYCTEACISDGTMPGAQANRASKAWHRGKLSAGHRAFGSISAYHSRHHALMRPVRKSPMRRCCG